MKIIYQSPMKISPVVLPRNTYTEVPLSVCTYRGSRYAFISTGHSGFTAVKGDFLHAADALDPAVEIVTWGDTRDKDAQLIPPAQIAESSLWKRNYYGALHAVNYTFNGKSYLLGIMHGENKNEHLGDCFYNNTVKPPETVYTAGDYAGYDADSGEYHDDWESYYAFIGLTYMDANTDTPDLLCKQDLGPVIWPDDPLLDASGKKISGGLRHPSAIVAGEYLYLYYLDESPSNRGHRVARAKLDAPEKLVFYKWDGIGFTIPALPQNFNRYDRSIVYQGTAPSKRLFPGFSARFSPVKVQNADWYLGVEERIDVNTGEVALYLFRSEDLVHWEDETLIPNTKAVRWYEGVLHYPILYDAAQSTTGCINLERFYIVGTYHYRQTQPMTQFVELSIRADEGIKPDNA